MHATTRSPSIRARSLEGRNLTLPDDLEGDPSVVLVAFKRTHQELVDSWLPELQRLGAEHPGLLVYEVPTIGRRWFPARRVIDGGMATAIRDRDTRERTSTACTDVGYVVRALGLPSADTIVAVLVDRSGAVRWQAPGPYTPELGRELAAVVEGVHA